MKKEFVTALKFLVLMTILTGIVYPLAMTGIAQILFPSKANGSLIFKDGKIIGSELIGQKFDSIKYFWSRPSSSDYNANPSAASNLGPTSNVLKRLVSERRKLFADQNNIADSTKIPLEMIFASGSGLDPHISKKAALLQADRVAAARNFSISRKKELVKKIMDMTEQPQFGFLGEQRINVLKLNLEADRLDTTLTDTK